MDLLIVTVGNTSQKVFSLELFNDVQFNNLLISIQMKIQ